MSKDQDFNQLVKSIISIHEELASQASKAVNISLTLRNWLIGCYIQEYELNGADRANYGECLLKELAKHLKNSNVSSSDKRLLYDYLKFYRVYPQITEVMPVQTKHLLPTQSLEPNQKVQTLSAQSFLSPEILFNSLSYSMFRLLVPIEDETKRAFYEVECIRGNWSVRELQRQMNSFYYERAGLSIDKDKLAEIQQKKAEKALPSLEVKDPYIFEFIGLKAKEVLSESDLEDELLDKLQEFLLELGYGFCFEARQKRILIGHTHYYVDLVFYHRVLKCHVLVEIKFESFSHENIGQLNTYVSWYRKNMMTEGDNPPVGILLCADKDQSLVEYALAGMDDNLFVSKYMIELPKKEKMQKFIEEYSRKVKK